MKKIIIIITIVVLVVLFGTWPLSVLSRIFSFLSSCIQWLAKTLNWFNWNGLV